MEGTGLTEIMADEAVLCYVRDGVAYFTTLPLDEQHGDDWGDAPYGANAGPPYTWLPGSAYHPPVPDRPRYWVVAARYEGLEAETPEEADYYERLSVLDINAGIRPWLTSPPGTREPRAVRLFAGTTLAEFTRAVEAAGGKVTVEGLPVTA